MLGEQIHDGQRHFTVRRENGRLHLLPAWMTDPGAASAKIVADPCLPVNRLLELRTFLDVLVASRWEESPPVEGGLMSKTMQKRQQPDLFETARVEHLPLAVQAAAAKLLSLLLSEAVTKAPAPPAQSTQEAGHDEDHR